jgi:hypothetical protein
MELGVLDESQVVIMWPLARSDNKPEVGCGIDNFDLEFTSK